MRYREREGLMLEWFRVGTFINSAGAVEISPDYISSGKNDPEWLLCWWVEIRNHMKNNDLKNLFLAYMSNEPMSQHEADALDGKLAAFWRRMKPNSDYYLSVAQKVKRKAA